MRRAAWTTVFVLTSALTAHAQPPTGSIDPGRVPARTAHDVGEYAFDTPVDDARWQAVAPGLHAAFGSVDDVYLRTEVPAVIEARSWEATGWRGERLHAPIVIWSADALDDVRIDVADLHDVAGHVISASTFGRRIVRYVVSDHPPGARDVTCDAGPTGAWLLPDRLEPYVPFHVPARSVRPVWLTLDVPATATPGTYRGHVRISAGPARRQLDISLSVKAATVPSPHEWAFRLDLWQNPWVLAWRNHLVPWSEEHKALLRRHLSLYADAGGKYITTYAVHSPWQDNSYWIEGGMIEWIKDADGRWRFDYRVFDEYVALAMEAGIDRAITVYTPVPWANRFRYLDGRTGAFVTEAWAPGSQAFTSAWRAFLDGLRAHLSAKGWFEKTYLGINEIDMPATRAAITVIREHSKDWRITYAGDWHPDLDLLIDDYSSVVPKEPSPAEIAGRRGRGATSTFYVCCTPPAPNTFVFSPPAEGRWLGWYAAARGYDGFLRWAYDAWPADPSRDARHVLWPAGDTFLVYPGAESSIRFETLREGIVDFEKLRLVRAAAARSTDPQVPALVSTLDRELAVIGTRQPANDAETREILGRARAALEGLADRVF